MEVSLMIYVHLKIKIFIVYFKHKVDLLLNGYKFKAGMFCTDSFVLRKNGKITSLVKEEAALRTLGIHISPVG